MRNNVASLIETVRTSNRRTAYAYTRAEKLEMKHVHLEFLPKVQYGNRLVTDDGTNNGREPLFAYDYEELARAREQHHHLLRGRIWTVSHSQYIASCLTTNVLRAKLKRAIDLYEEKLRDCGAAVWTQRHQAALAEYREAIRKFARAVPKTKQEAAAKAKFLAVLMDREACTEQELTIAVKTLAKGLAHV